MYEAIVDPYCHEGTPVLRNKLGIRDAKLLQDFEEEITKQRAAEPLPCTRLGASHDRTAHDTEGVGGFPTLSLILRCRAAASKEGSRDRSEIWSPPSRPLAEARGTSG